MATTTNQKSDPSGFVVIDKDPDWTSHDVVAKTRSILKTRKVGHSGTLDPSATGVLILGVGKGTRLLRFLTELPKTYVAEAVLGVETDTLDADGEVSATHDMSHITIADVVRAAKGFVGDIEQIPPMVSAIKIDGKRLHQLAREGKTVERKARPVTIHSLDVEEVVGEPNIFRFTTTCSSGTYIRTLAADIAHVLGGGAHLRYLRRTTIGSHVVADATTIDEFEREGQTKLIPLAKALCDYPQVTLDEDDVARVRMGQKIDRSGLTGNGPWAMVDTQGELVAVFEMRSGQAKSAVVIPA